MIINYTDNCFFRLNIKIIPIRTAYFFLLLIYCKHLFGQNEFIVVNANTGKPIEGVSVYISGSSYGTVTDVQGRFSLKPFPSPPYKLTFSAVGYRTQTADITEKTQQTLRIHLTEAITELKEVVVGKPMKNGWERYGQEFLRLFIGYSPFAEKSRILNTEVLSFFDDVNTRTLRVSAKKPLIIRNEALGYTITYWLEEFEMNYATKMLMIQGSSLFRDMNTPKTSEKRRKLWLLNRESAYRGSVQHFMRSMYSGTVAEEGFELRALRRISNDSVSHYLAVTKDTFYVHPPSWDFLHERLLKSLNKQNNSSMAMPTSMLADQMLERLKNWYYDTTLVEPIQFRFKLNAKEARPILPTDTIVSGRNISLLQSGMKEMVVLHKSGGSIMGISYPVPDDADQTGRQGTFDMLYRQPLRADSFVHAGRDGEVQLKFEHYLHITYTREKEEDAYVINSGSFGFSKKREAVEQASIISMKETDRLILFSSGHFEPSRQLLVEGYWSYEKQDKLLPLDYISPQKSKN